MGKFFSKEESYCFLNFLEELERSLEELRERGLGLQDLELALDLLACDFCFFFLFFYFFIKSEALYKSLFCYRTTLISLENYTLLLGLLDDEAPIDLFLTSLIMSI